ncbi:unnamed protein product [Macrosiphum euphorbiae]|uniref:Reverse transcriptase n=1 Tax=Macrosiphum euphorbiae TaxID=13131 RepID=A0AAV0WF97_9HEMI|nr:unnamed protein product [Macrosiphum euphorbiae]
MMHQHRQSEWTTYLASLRPRDPKVYKLNKSLINRRPPDRPLNSPQGPVFDAPGQAELFAANLVVQFNCPEGTPSTNDLVTSSIRTLHSAAKSRIQPVSPGEVQLIVKRLPRNKAPGPDSISNMALRHFSDKTLLVQF